MGYFTCLCLVVLVLCTSAADTQTPSGSKVTSLQIKDVGETTPPSGIQYSYKGKFYMYEDESIEAFNHLRGCTCTVGSWVSLTKTPNRSGLAEHANVTRSHSPDRGYAAMCQDR